MNDKFKNEVIERIQSIVVPEDLVNIKIGAIPLGKGVILSKVKGGERMSESGIILPEMKSTWQQIARIVALGPDCSQNLKTGLLVTYNSMADIETVIHGKSYIIANEVSIEVIIEDEQNTVVVPKMPKNESPEALDRAERNSTFKQGIKNIRKKGENDNDALHEKVKDIKKNPITSKYKK